MTTLTDVNSPLWRILSSIDVPMRMQPAVQLSHVARAVAEAFDAHGDSAPLKCDVVVARVPSSVLVPAHTFRRLYLPLAVLLSFLYDRSKPAARLLVGVAAPAGAGKSTTCALLALIGTAWASIMGKLFPSYPTPPAFASLSMDGYHRTNADLSAHNLLHFKGRRDTIDGSRFAHDLARLRERNERDELVDLPEYDRLVTHDVVPGAIHIHPEQGIILVEGLFMCSAGGGHVASSCSSSEGGSDGGFGLGTDGETRAATSPQAEHVQERAWADVASLLDLVVILSVPMVTCRRRTVDRKVANGFARTDAEEHYDRVDRPVWVAVLEHDTLKPVHPGTAAAILHNLVSSETQQMSDPLLQPVAVQRRGPDLVLHMDDALNDVGDITRDAVDLIAVAVRAPRWHPRAKAFRALSRDGENCAHGDSAGAATEQPSVVVVGMTPCVQRTLVYGISESGDGLPYSRLSVDAGKGSWTRGGVNRAVVSTCTIGGKGPHTALAVARAAAHASAALAAVSTTSAAHAAGSRNVSDQLLDFEAAPASLRMPPHTAVAVDLCDFIGGDSGAQAERFFRDAVDAATVVGSSTNSRAAATVRHHSTHLAASQPTRTCVTILDHSVGDMTEFVEPPSRATSEDISALLTCVRSIVRDRLDATGRCGTSSAPSVCLALMGTFPHGGERVYEELSMDAAKVSKSSVDVVHAEDSASSAPSSHQVHRSRGRLVVLMDAYKGVRGALLAGGVNILKVNIDEIRSLAAECEAAAAILEVTRRNDVDAGVGEVTLRAFPPSSLQPPIRDALTVLQQYGGSSTGLMAVVITAGAGDAFVVEALETGAVAIHRVTLPPLRVAVCNPIGAGDVVAGVTLYALLHGSTLAAATCEGLAAGSASVLTLRGAEWDSGEATRVHSELRVTPELLFMSRSA